MRQNLFNKLHELGIIALESEMKGIEEAIKMDKRALRDEGSQEEQIWKDVIGLEGVYQISSTGRLRNNKTKVLLQPSYSRKGYVVYTTIQKGFRKTLAAHRLVAYSFIPNPEGKEQINHINGIKSDNRVENLEWATAKENMRHASSTGLLNNMGEAGRSKLTNIDVLDIRSVYIKGEISMKEIASHYNVSISSIYNILSRKKWKHI
jgi:hypothetical protein